MKNILSRMKRALYYKSLVNYEDYSNTKDFIFLKHKTSRWKAVGFEKVGNDWHIRVKRLQDKRVFLLDQPFFYILQIPNRRYDDGEINMLYGISKEDTPLIKRVLSKLKLC